MDAIDDALMGYDEVGYDEMGRRIVRRAPAGRSTGRSTGRNPNLPGNGAQYQADRLFPFPVNSAAAIAAAGTATCTNRPQATCKPVRYIVHSVYDSNPALVAATAWLINWIQIGQRLQAIANGGVCGDTFANIAVATSFEFDTAQMGQDVGVNVTDMGGITAAKTATFRSTFLCKALHY